MSTTLTPTEEKVFQYLIEFLAANSYQPSIREIGRQFDIKSTKTVSDVLGNLARKGYIQRNQARSRGLRILGPQAGGMRTVPFYSSVSAIGPALTAEHRTDAIVLDRRVAPSDDAFFVRVGDNAMANGGIHCDATVLVSPDFTPMDGDTVVVRIGSEAVVRTYEVRDSGTWLASCDAAVPAMELAPDDGATILGVVYAVFRNGLQVSRVSPPAEEAA